MSLTYEQLMTLAESILSTVDYDTYKEVKQQQEEEGEDSFTLLDEIADLISEYVEIN